MDTIILIPAYNPEPAMIATAKELHEAGYGVLVVNDGSHPSYSMLFEMVSQYATVIGYEKNGGKGHALKCGFHYIMTHMRDRYKYVVTADADGQHAVKDIIKVDNLLRLKGNIVIGSRDFSGNVPFRSRLGNTLSRFAYTIETGRYIRDNQSGLRGFDADLCEWLIGIKGEKYDYEINVLMYAAKQNIPICETTIQTIYIEGNRSSHFDPIRDTVRLHAKMLMASLPSIAAFCIFVIAFFTTYSIYSFRLVQISVAMAISLAGGIGIMASIALNGMHFYSSGTIKYSFPLKATVVSLVRTGGYATLMSLFVNIWNMSLGVSILLAVILIMPGEYVWHRMLGRKHIYDL